MAAAHEEPRRLRPSSSHTTNQTRRRLFVEHRSRHHPAGVASKQAKEQHAGWRLLASRLARSLFLLGDVELLAHIDTVKELTDILPLHRRRLLDARGCVVKTKRQQREHGWKWVGTVGVGGFKEGRPAGSSEANAQVPPQTPEIDSTQSQPKGSTHGKTVELRQARDGHLPHCTIFMKRSERNAARFVQDR